MSNEIILTEAQRKLQLLKQQTALERSQTSTGKDLAIVPNRIVITPDVSGSMCAPFGKCSRVEAAKRSIDKIITASDAKSTAYSLVTFNSEAHLILPMGTPYAKFITTDLYANGGTDIHAALTSALTQNPSRVILLSDGGSYGPPCIDLATNVFKPRGIKIDTIAIGTDWAGESGLLQTLSEITGGVYQTASDADELEKIFLALEPRNYLMLEHK